MKQHVNMKIYGRVQEVLFRFSTRERAQLLGILGFAQNMPDGSVYIEAEGECPRLLEFVDWCRKGPPLAEISKVEVKFSQTMKHFTAFESIRKKQ